MGVGALWGYGLCAGLVYVLLGAECCWCWTLFPSTVPTCLRGTEMSTIKPTTSVTLHLS